MYESLLELRQKYLHHPPNIPPSSFPLPSFLPFLCRKQDNYVFILASIKILAILSYPPTFLNTAKPLRHVNLADNALFGWSHWLAQWRLERLSQILSLLVSTVGPAICHTTVALNNDNGTLFKAFTFHKYWLGIQSIEPHWIFMLLFLTRVVNTLLKLAWSHISDPSQALLETGLK